MTDDKAFEPHPDHLVAENVTEAVWLRLRRLTSSTLCERIVSARAENLTPEVISKKGQEIASSVRSALGYWQSQPASLNAKVLTRYYALLQISIAEQVASPLSTANLQEIQSHTERGHGLWTITNPNEDFPASYMVACVTRGHFYEYCRFKGMDFDSFASKARPDSWNKLSVAQQERLVSLADLLRRIPELQRSIEETLGQPPLSFRVGHASENMRERVYRAHQHASKTGEVLFNPPLPGPDATTYVGIYPDGQNLTLEYLNTLDLPLKNIRRAKDDLSKWPYFIGDLSHPKDKYWHECIKTYKSGYCGTSIIVPIWNQIDDPFLIHLMALYALSIVVRYLPQLWHEIEDGKLDHIRELIEYYLVIVDNVLPQVAVTRITGRRLIAYHPGSLHGPT